MVALEVGVLVFLTCIVPACLAAFVMLVVYGPVPTRRVPIAARSTGSYLPSTVVGPVASTGAEDHRPQTSFEPIPAAIEAAIAAAVTAPVPPPVVRATAVEPPRERHVMNPALAPVVRGGALPPLRRSARGTDAPLPQLPPRLPPPPRHAAPPPIPRADTPRPGRRDPGAFELDDPTHVDGY